MVGADGSRGYVHGHEHPQHRRGQFAAGFSLKITASEGTTYYTIDGSDPRLFGGKLSPKAASYTGPLVL